VTTRIKNSDALRIGTKRYPQRSSTIPARIAARAR
jgi:hypothetical protein